MVVVAEEPAAGASVLRPHSGACHQWSWQVAETRRRDADTNNVSSCAGSAARWAPGDNRRIARQGPYRKAHRLPKGVTVAGTLLVGATVWAGADCRPRPGWLLVSGDRIAASDAAGEPLPTAGRVLDLPGRHVLPGLVDAHQHPSLTAWVPRALMASAGQTCPPRWRRSAPRSRRMRGRRGWCSGTRRRTPGRSGGCPPPPSWIGWLRAAGCWSASGTCTASRYHRRRWPSLGWAPRPVGGGQTLRVTGADGPPASCGSTRAAPRWQRHWPQAEQPLGSQQVEAALEAELDRRLRLHPRARCLRTAPAAPADAAAG